MVRKQGYSLGKQLSIWVPALRHLLDRAHAEGKTVWFLGRDCDVFAACFRDHPASRYLVGLNRDNAGKLHRRMKMSKWLRSIGVREGDIFMDSGYSGSIYSRMQDSGMLNYTYYLLTASEYSSGTALVPELNNKKNRAAILALEHSPKREVCSWDRDRRAPKVYKSGDAAARRFFDGCVASLKEKLKEAHYE